MHASRCSIFYKLAWALNITLILCRTGHFDGLVHDRHNSSVLAMELHLSCNNPLIYFAYVCVHRHHMNFMHINLEIPMEDLCVCFFFFFFKDNIASHRKNSQVTNQRICNLVSIASRYWLLMSLKVQAISKPTMTWCLDVLGTETTATGNLSVGA